MHVDVMPEPHDLGLAADFLDFLVHQLDHLGEGLLAGGYLLWVDIVRLQEREEQFAGTAVVRVRCCKHNWNIQSLKHLQALVAHVIRCIVGQNYRVTAPAFPLSIQNCTQLLEEDAYSLGVVVALAHRVIDVAQGVEGDREGDSGRQLLLGLRVSLADLAPRHPSIISLVQPALVHVQDDFVLDVLPQKDLRPCLALVDVERRVNMQGLLPDPAKLQLKMLLQHRYDKVLGEFDVLTLQNVLTYLLPARYLIFVLDEPEHFVHHELPVVNMLLLLLEHSAHVVLVFLGFVDQLR